MLPSVRLLLPRLFAGLVSVSLGCDTHFDSHLLDGGGGDGGGGVRSCLGEADGTPCRGGGTCRAESCCTGCWDGIACLDGDVFAACGAGGAECVVCRDPYDICDMGQCRAEDPAMSIASGSAETCAVMESGSLWCWGGDSGALIVGGAGPVLVPSPGAPWRSVTIGWDYVNHGCGVSTEGEIACWGSNADGELGLGQGSGDHSGQDGAAVVDFPAGTTARGAAVAALAAATSAILDDGSLWSWGWNSESRLGTMSVSDTAYTPFLVDSNASFELLSAGSAHGAAIGTDGALLTWGWNQWGQLGRSGDQAPPMVVGTNYRFVSAGERHTCAIRTDGTLSCWGANDTGQLGVSGAGGSTPVEVEPSGEWESVFAGYVHTCGIRSGGKLWCWGGNEFNQLGLGEGMPDVVSSPMEVMGEGYVAAALGGRHTCAIKTDGLVYCFGSNSHRQTADVGARAFPTAIRLPPP